MGFSALAFWREWLDFPRWPHPPTLPTNQFLPPATLYLYTLRSICETFQAISQTFPAIYTILFKIGPSVIKAVLTPGPMPVQFRTVKSLQKRLGKGCLQTFFYFVVCFSLFCALASGREYQEKQSQIRWNFRLKSCRNHSGGSTLAQGGEGGGSMVQEGEAVTCLHLLLHCHLSYLPLTASSG